MDAVKNTIKEWKKSKSKTCENNKMKEAVEVHNRFEILGDKFDGYVEETEIEEHDVCVQSNNKTVKKRN